jgi:hypothetical protein
VSQRDVERAPAYFKKAMQEAESEWSTHHAKVGLGLGLVLKLVVPFSAGGDADSTAQKRQNWALRDECSVLAWQDAQGTGRRGASRPRQSQQRRPTKASSPLTLLCDARSLCPVPVAPQAVIDTTAKKGLRESVPPGFPYLYVQVRSQHVRLAVG